MSRCRFTGAAAVLLLTALLAPRPAGAQTGLLIPTSTGRPDSAVLSIREMTLDIGVARGYARVNLVQIFENHTGSIQEGTWRFRLPESGAVGDFAVWDGNVRIPGVILEKRRARAIYRDLTAQRIDPGLLEQGEEEDSAPSAAGRPAEKPSGGALFSVKVAPIPAWGTKRLEMQFQYELPWLDGVAELRLPLRPSDGEPPAVGRLDVTVRLLDGAFEAAVPGALELARDGKKASFTGANVTLAKDVVVRFRRVDAAPLAMTAFRNPTGTLPDGLALAPWERPADIPTETDGFFLLEYAPKARSKGAPAESEPSSNPAATPPAQRAPLSLALLFDTSLSHRWSGLEAGWAALVKVLDRLGPQDRFVVVPFDRVPAPDPRGLAAATPESKRAALEYLRSRPLSPGTDVAAGLKAGASVLARNKNARLVLITDGSGPSGEVDSARGGIPMYTVMTGEERRESLGSASSASVQVASSAGAAAEETAEWQIFERLLFTADDDAPPQKRKAVATGGLPFTVKGGDPKLRDVYSVLTQPPVPGALSGWVGRYAAPVANATLTMQPPAEPLSVTASFPESALDARDLPRRWARARVDDLLRRIEAEGEKREWVDEILALSRRYKFVTPYTAFLAAPRSLLRPRRIQPGDPVIRIEADPGIVAASALLPFGKRIELVKKPASSLWQGRFLVPEGLPDGRVPVRLVLRDVSGRTIVETKHVVLDGTAPTVVPVPRGAASAGKPFLVSARADADVIFLVARLDEGPPIPLRWDPETKTSIAELQVAPGLQGTHELFFEATDGAGNHGFARAKVEVRP